MILSYPVITSGKYAHRGSFDALLGDKKDDGETLKALSIENRVTKDTPKAFIWSTFEDVTVPCENALLIAKALRKETIWQIRVFKNSSFIKIGLKKGQKTVIVICAYALFY